MCGFVCAGSGATRTNGVGIEPGSVIFRLTKLSVFLLLFSWAAHVFWDMGGESVEAEAVEAEAVEAIVTKLAF